jgi:hypothetical protein
VRLQTGKKPAKGQEAAQTVSKMTEIAMSKHQIPLAENISRLSHLAMGYSDHPKVLKIHEVIVFHVEVQSFNEIFSVSALFLVNHIPDHVLELLTIESKFESVFPHELWKYFSITVVYDWISLKKTFAARRE